MIIGIDRTKILRRMREVREQLDLEEADEAKLVSEYRALLARLLGQQLPRRPKRVVP